MLKEMKGPGLKATVNLASFQGFETPCSLRSSCLVQIFDLRLRTKSRMKKLKAGS